MKKSNAISMLFWLAATAAMAQTSTVKLDPALPEYRLSAPMSGEVRISGNLEDMETLMNLWIAAMKKVQPGIHFTLDQVHNSTGKGVRALLGGVPTDVTLMGREMRAPELAEFTGKYGYAPRFIAVAGGSYQTHGKSPAPVFFVNKANPLTRLSLDQLDGMYSKTLKRASGKEIRTWGQLGLKGEWENRRITLYGLNAAAGTWTYLRGRILLGGEYRDGIKAVKYENEDADWDEMINDVAKDVTGIGFASGSYLKGNANVRPIALAEKVGGPYFEATLDNVATHRYPVSRAVYMTLAQRPGAPIDPTVRELLNFVLSKEGQQAVQQEGEFLPLPAGIVKEERAKLQIP
jgi:phosphate transport system substrate-binding protein